MTALGSVQHRALFNRMPQLRKTVNAPSPEIGDFDFRTLNRSKGYEKRKKIFDGGLRTVMLHK